MERVKDFFFVLTHPSFWIKNYPTSLSYDAWLRGMMDKREKVIILDPFTVQFGGQILWIENYPYAFAHRCNGTKSLPTSRTRKRFMEYISNPDNVAERKG